jgi:exosortase
LTTEVGSPGGLDAAAAAAARDASIRRRAYLTTGGLVIAAMVVFGPILHFMVIHWRIKPDYSHGFLVAPLAVYFAWERRGRLRRTPIEPSWWGLVPLFLGSLALAIGRLGVELMAMRTAFPLTVIGLVLLLLGVRVFQVLAFPLLFLFLMIPLPQSLVNVIAFPLQLVAADLAVSSLHAIGVSALREGNIIHLAVKGGDATTQLFVAEACSGLRSLMALGTLGVVFAYFFRRNAVERVIIVLSTIPIAILVNAFRVGLTGFLTYHWGKGAAEGWIHQTEGFFTFGLAFGLLLVEAWLLHLFWPRAWRRGSARRQPA